MTTGRLSISIRAVAQEQAPVADAVDEFLSRHDVPPLTAIKLQIALDEILANIISYAYPPDAENPFAQISLAIDHRAVTMVIVDAGKPFDPLTAADPDTTLDIDDREIGGFGILLVRKQMDDVRYERRGDNNCLTLVKTLS